MNLSNYPVLKLLLPFITGILLAYFPVHPILSQQGWAYLMPVCLLVGLLTLLSGFMKRYRWHTVRSILPVCCFLLLGLCVAHYHLQSPFTRKEQKIIAENDGWVVRILDYPVERAKSVKTLVEIWQTCDGKPIRGKALLYIAKTPKTLQLRYGDILCVQSSLTEIAPPVNPDAFDLQRYMQRRGIYYNGYVTAQGWLKIGNKEPNHLKAAAERIRQKLTAVFVASGLTGNEYDIITAILLGNDDTMNPELKAGYAAAGVSHILCVSGMHVGIIYMILNFLLKPMDLFQSTRIGKALLLLLLIWLYANITGLSPSVTRSATMFTFVTVGSLIHRNTNIFHSLFASLFILLIINPLLLFEVGFQLSYLAVFGIVILQKPLVGLYTCKTKIGHYFWELITVSVSAQIGTFPISIYCFGQFPNYFILSNLSVISLSFVIMITGIALLAISFIKFMVPWTSWLLIHEIKGMNGIIGFIGNLPGAVTQNIEYSWAQVLLLYGCIIMLFLALTRHKRKAGWIAYGLFTLFSSCFFLKKVEMLHQQEVVVYSIRKTCAIGFHLQGEGILFTDSIRDKQNRTYQYAIQNHERKRHIQSTIISIDTARYVNRFLCKNNNFILYGDRQYYLLKGKDKLYETGICRPIDVLLIENNPKMKPDVVFRIIPFKQVIADETNTPYYVQRWRAYCDTAGIDFRYTGKP